MLSISSPASVARSFSDNSNASEHFAKITSHGVILPRLTQPPGRPTALRFTGANRDVQKYNDPTQ
jgi:hypothetical protein